MLERIIDQFLKLVAIDSPSGQEENIRNYIKGKLKQLNLTYIQDAFGNVFAWVNCIEAPLITFACHIDTVGNAQQVKPMLDGEYIRTDGTTALGADDKIAVALALLLVEKRQQYGPFGLLFSVQEEVGLQGAKHLGPEILSQLNRVFVFDTGRPVGTVIVQAPWKLDVKIAFHGKAAHAGVSPELGISAISLAGKAIAKMDLLRIDEQTTANIGSIHGGTSTNVVCDLVNLHLEIRSLVRQRAFDHLQHIKHCCQVSCSEGGGSFSLAEEVSYDGYQIEASEAQNLFHQACNACNIPYNAISSGGGSDVNMLRAHGIDAVLLGVGYEKAHSTQERISKKELEKLVQIAEQLLRYRYLV